MKLLVIGYGNELRRDDGVGPLVARVVSGWQLPGVVAVASHGLMPELSEQLSRAETALFVDAKQSPRAGLVDVRPGPASPLGHVGGPGWLLALAESVLGVAPRAWLLTVAAEDFGHGEGLTRRAEAGLAEALALVCRLARGGVVAQTAASARASFTAGAGGAAKRS
jgi:hydrogenase maturation protease